MELLLLCDFGSTYTKLVAVDPKAKKIAATAKSYTTIETDVTLGYELALNEITKKTGKNTVFTKKLASSSAAGGLKIISSGLVPDLTAKASRLAAASAGAKIIKTYSYELTAAEEQYINYASPDIVLLSGGTDGGNKDVLLHNARVVARTTGSFAVIIAGNRSVAEQAASIIAENGKEVVITENVMPDFNSLNIAPVKDVIRELFIKNIISAKGLDKIQAIMDMDIIPTPLAVFEACELLSTDFGELMAYDLGGATTDVYSMAKGLPAQENCFLQGIPEPFAKRTVEGDIGMRYSAEALIALIDEEQGLQNFCTKNNIDFSAFNKWQDICKKSPGVLPVDEYASYQPIDEALAKAAISLSTNRHVGTKSKVKTLAGEAFLQEGKDLTKIKHIIASGGAVINAKNPRAIMEAAFYAPQDLNLLKPFKADIWLDSANCLSAAGLLSRIEPQLALLLMKDNFDKI
ncbi:MAG: methylaspartate mutase accessory protein GlmL [Defluviitaleaceae bacterium]|nr:methylaspartate mutase accessory protein GlmL [Defluviitaleaceae bacterium]